MAMGYIYSGPYVVIKSMLKGLENDKKFIDAYIHHLDLPKWLREISSVQEDAANRLLNALRDDMEQDTAHRVRNILMTLGIEPIVCDRELKAVMFFSRGNDIAFLYLLNEWFYATEDPDYFTVNEQLLYSYVAHLDMVCTLRALHGLLPPPQPRKSVVLRKKKLEEEANLKKQKAEKCFNHKRKSHTDLDKNYEKFAPYFNKLVNPQPMHQKITVNEKLYQSSFGRYEVWKDPTYIVPNENNRWYVYYFYRPGKPNRSQSFHRRVMSIVRNPRHHVKLKFSNKHKWDPWYSHEDVEDAPHAIIKNELKNLINDKVLKNIVLKRGPSMCQHHRQCWEMEELKAHEDKIRKRDKCLKYFDTEAKYKEKVKKRVLERLENDVQRYTCESKRASDRIRHGALAYIATCSCGGVDTLIDDGCTCWEEAKASLSDLDKEKICYPNSTKCFPFSSKSDLKLPPRRATKRLFGGCNSEITNDLEKKSFDELSASSSDRARYIQDELRYAGGDDIIDDIDDIPEIPSEIPPRKCDCKIATTHINARPNAFASTSLKRTHLSNLLSSTNVMNTEQSIQKKRKKKKVKIKKKTRVAKKARTLSTVFAEALQIIYPSDIKFERDLIPLKQTPSSESFFKAPTNNSPYIFDYPKIFNLNQNDIEPKPYIVQSDDSECEPNESFDLEEVIFKALTQNLKNKEISYEHVVDETWRNMVSDSLNLQVKLDKDTVELEKEIMKINPIRLKYQQDYYDPDDRELLDTMLKDALKFMATQRRYVLAGFPDAHKMPILREWVYKRFGKEYTQEERIAGYRRAIRIIHSMQNIALVIPILDEGLTAKTYLDFDCLPYYKKKAELYKKRFYTLINEVLMETSRIFWYSLRAFQYTSAPTKDVFFAYMPSRIRDIHKFRIWQPTEYRDNKLIWSRRWMGIEID